MRYVGFLGAVALIAASAMLPGMAHAERVRVAALKGLPAAPIFIAEHKGYFRAEGLDLEMIYIDAAAAAPVAVASGDADFTVVGATGGFYNLAGAGALKIVGASVREQPGYNLSGYVVSNKAFEKGFRSVKDLPGKTIAITTAGSTYHYNLGQIAQKLGFGMNEIRMMPLQSQANQAAAVAGGTVDGAVITAYILSKMEAEGSGHIIGWVGDHTPYQTSVAITSTRNADSRPDYVKRFLRAYLAGIRDYHATFLTKDANGNFVKGAEYDTLLKVLTGYIQQPADQLVGYFPYIDPEGRLETASIKAQLKWFQSQALVESSVKLDDFLDMRYIKDLPPVTGQ